MGILNSKSFLLTVLFFYTCFFFAQNTNKNNDVNVKHKKIALQTTRRTTIDKSIASEPQQNKYENVNPNPVSSINEDDIYQGRQNEILSNLTVKQIPVDFPKYEKGKGIIWYNGQMDNYYRNHPDITTEMVRKKFGL